MEISTMTVTTTEVKATAKLDTIQVFWADYGDHRGSVTITCFGCAWTAYFGAMMSETIREFFLHADTDYLTTKLGIAPNLKETKRNRDHLSRIIETVKAALAEEASTPRRWSGILRGRAEDRENG
jgi:hypothetical protein